MDSGAASQLFLWHFACSVLRERVGRGVSPATTGFRGRRKASPYISGHARAARQVFARTKSQEEIQMHVMRGIATAALIGLPIVASAQTHHPTSQKSKTQPAPQQATSVPNQQLSE